MSSMFGEVDISALHIGPYQFHTEFVAYVEALLTLRQQSLHMWIDDPDERSVLRHAGDDGTEGFPNAAAHGHGSDVFGHRALNFLRGIFLHCAIAGDGGKIAIGIWRGLF